MTERVRAVSATTATRAFAPNLEVHRHPSEGGAPRQKPEDNEDDGAGESAKKSAPATTPAATVELSSAALHRRRSESGESSANDHPEDPDA